MPAGRVAPPRLAEALASLLIPPAVRDELVGDLRERFAGISERKGRRAAVRWYWGQVTALRPGALRRQVERAGLGWVTVGKVRGGGSGMMGGSWGLELRQAARSLRLRPGASLTVTLTVALAIGATTAVFSVVDGVLLEPLPFPQPNRLVRVWQTKVSWTDSPRPQLRAFAEHFPFSVPTFDDVQRQAGTFSALGAFASAVLTFHDDGRPDVVQGERVTSGLFRALGVDPALGRYLVPDDDRPGAVPVIVLSHGTWRDRYGADPGIVGRELHFGSETRTVVGVMPSGFSLPGAADAFWISLPENEKPGERDSHSFNVIGRLRPGTTVESAGAEAGAIAARLAAAYPDDQGGLGARVETLLDSVVGEVRATLWLLLGAVGLVLVIACVNVANVLAVMGLARRGELAVKAALGAGWRRLARGRLVESLLLVSAGGVLGVCLAALAVPALASVLPPDLPRRDDVTLNTAVVAFGIGVTVLTSVLVGLIPALQAGRMEPARVMGEAGRSVAGGWGGALRSGFVAAEVALSFVLMTGAGLLGGSFVRLWHVDRGFDTEGLIEAVVLPDRERYPTRADQDRFSAALRERLAAIPGAEVSATSQVPLSGSASSTTYLVQRADALPDSARGVLRSEVLDNYFEVMGIPIVEGRSFRPTDVVDAPAVAIVNETMARELWPGASPLGRHVRHGEDEPWMTVVGVARDVRHMRLDTPVEPKLYLPAVQSSQTATSWVVRAHGDLDGVVQRIRDAVAEVSPDTPVRRVQILKERIASSVAVPRFRAGLVVGLAGMAAVLALLGVYGVTSFAVSQRTREIGVRIALGSLPDAVVRRIVLQGLRLTGLGLVLGFIVAIPASRLVAGFLFGVEPDDPVTFMVTASLVGAISMLAAFLPARRAASVDPVTVLKAE